MDPRVQVRVLRLQQNAARGLARLRPEIAGSGGSPRDAADSTDSGSDGEQNYIDFGGDGEENETEQSTPESFLALLAEAQPDQELNNLHELHEFRGGGESSDDNGELNDNGGGGSSRNGGNSSNYSGDSGENGGGMGDDNGVLSDHGMSDDSGDLGDIGGGMTDDNGDFNGGGMSDDNEVLSDHGMSDDNGNLGDNDLPVAEAQPAQSVLGDDEPEMLSEIVSRIAGNKPLFVPLGAKLSDHLRLQRGRRTELTPWFELPCAYNYSFADVTGVNRDRVLEFTAAARWLFKTRLDAMNPAEYVGVRICKNGFSTVSAKARITGYAYDLRNCEFPFEDYDVTLESVIVKCPDDMFKTLEDNVRNKLTTDDLRVMWHAGGVQYPGRRTPRSEMVELLTDQGQPVRVENAYRQSVEETARSHGAVTVSEEETVALVDDITCAFAEANAYFEKRRRQAEENTLEQTYENYEQALNAISNLPHADRREARRLLHQRSTRSITTRIRRVYQEESLQELQERLQRARRARSEQIRRHRYDETMEEIANHPAEDQAAERRQLDRLFRRAECARIRRLRR